MNELIFDRLSKEDIETLSGLFNKAIKDGLNTSEYIDSIISNISNNDTERAFEARRLYLRLCEIFDSSFK